VVVVVVVVGGEASVSVTECSNVLVRVRAMPAFLCQHAPRLLPVRDIAAGARVEVLTLARAAAHRTAGQHRVGSVDAAALRRPIRTLRRSVDTRGRRRAGRARPRHPPVCRVLAAGHLANPAPLDIFFGARGPFRAKLPRLAVRARCAAR
jgi:hypothetical protein